WLAPPSSGFVSPFERRVRAEGSPDEPTSIDLLSRVAGAERRLQEEGRPPGGSRGRALHVHDRGGGPRGQAAEPRARAPARGLRPGGDRRLSTAPRDEEHDGGNRGGPRRSDESQWEGRRKECRRVPTARGH